MLADNKFRQFSFKPLHRILVTKQELKRCKIKPDDAKVQIPLTKHSWIAFNCRGILLTNDDMVQQPTEIPINMTKQQILFNNFTLPVESQHLLRWKFRIFITLMKKYIYDYKMMEKFTLGNQLQQKLNNQWKIKNSGN